MEIYVKPQQEITNFFQSVEYIVYGEENAENIAYQNEYVERWACTLETLENLREGHIFI